ncbi:transposase [Streptomyces sp. NBC_01620]|uniref:transposase n=1 Tax=Streptomyces sp. NBC_01620 TaxID=2975902 RepID=UPI003865C18F
MTFFFALEEEIAKATAELSTVLPDTPACVLTSLPGVGIVTASAYGAAIGDPARFKNAAGAYRAPASSPSPTNPQARAAGATGSAVKDRSSCDARSSTSAVAWASTTPTSSPTAAACSPKASRRWSRPSQWATEPTASPSL